MGANASVMRERDTETNGTMDVVDEIRLRTWARVNYVPADERDDNWHPIVLDEMIRRDREETRKTGLRSCV